MNDHGSDWRPTASLAVLQRRAEMLRKAREFFAQRDVLEVETPAITDAGVTDPHIGSIACRLATAPENGVYLHTSPEFAMKRLLAAGSPDIYQVCKVFRDLELGALHQPEFTMIEWYRKDMVMDAMIDETCALITALHASALPVTRCAYRDLFLAELRIDPVRATVDQLIRCATETADAVTPEFTRQLGEDRLAWLDFLMSVVIVSRLPPGELVAVHHYPAEQAALARLDPEDKRFSERFEVFFQGLELANGYRELTDVQEHRRRFAADRERRAALKLPDMQPDRVLLAALEHGLPECCGVAVGFDRVVMTTVGAPTIAEAMSFGRGRTPH
jgi:lysyl-tRNA synthetase class 2